MLVVIPVCHKDEALVLKNLDWVRELDGKVAAKAVIACSDEFKATAVIEKAWAAFTQVEILRYSEWGGDPKWPQPQNWAWQSVARLLVTYSPQSWLWWEADSTPTRKGWLDALKKEYEAGGKPFMGYITDQNGTEPHMAGVGVYPPEIAQYSVNAMLCRAAPFDVVMARDTLAQTHKANHLIQHYAFENCDSTHFPTSASVDEIVQPGVVLFHRCKDGSLIDRLRDPRSVSGRLKSLFSKPKPKTWPSITKQTEWDCGFFDLPSHNTECHFNCALTEQDQNLWLVSRRWRKSGHLPWQSDIVRHRLGAKFEIKETIPIALQKQCGFYEQHEDPRIIRHGPVFLLGYCSWLMGEKFQAHQALATLDSNWNCVSTLHLLYGNNGPYPGAGIGHEKNWTWFIHEGQLHLDYQFSPHIVVALDDNHRGREHKTQTPIASKWKHGHIRGGTPPVRIGDEYFSFFHSSMPWRARQNRYFMGAFAFEAKPPFAVTRITPEPLLAGSEEDPRSLGGPLVVFPCGVLFETAFSESSGREEYLFVTLGVNDQSCAWIRIPISDLCEKMT